MVSPRTFIPSKYTSYTVAICILTIAIEATDANWYIRNSGQANKSYNITQSHMHIYTQ